MPGPRSSGAAGIVVGTLAGLAEATGISDGAAVGLPPVGAAVVVGRLVPPGGMVSGVSTSSTGGGTLCRQTMLPFRGVNHISIASGSVALGSSVGPTDR